MTHIDTAPLSWIFPEIRVAATEAQEALTKYRAAPNDVGSLHLSTNRVHHLHGALQILDISGLSVVSEAIEALLNRFDVEPETATSTAIDAVDEALTAITVYCEELLAGSAHQPLRLFPYLRDLLTERGAERIHPADLFFPDLTARLPEQQSSSPPVADSELAKILRIARQRYEAGLLPLLQGETSAEGLSNLREALDTVAKYQVGAYSRSFWRATVALIDVLRSHGLAIDLNIKRFAARLNLQVKRVVDGSPQVAERLFKDCLYFIACAHSSEASVREVQSQFGLLGIIPSDFETTRFIRVDRALLVHAKEKLAQMKGVWNQAAGPRDGDYDAVKRGRIEPLEQFIKNATELANWFGQLQLEQAKRLVQSLAKAVSNNVEKQALPSDALGLEIASTILYLELLLNAVHSPDARREERISALISRVQAVSEGRDPGPAEAWLNEIARREQDRTTLHMLAKELATQLASIEKNLDAFFRNPTDKSSIAGNDAPLAQIEGALGLLGLVPVQHAVAYVRAKLVNFASEEYLPDPTDFTQLAQNYGRLTLAIETFARDQDLAADRYEFDQVSGQLRENLNRFKAIPPQLDDEEVLVAVSASVVTNPSEVSLEDTVAAHQKKTVEIFNTLKSQPTNQSLKDDLSQSLLRMRDDAAIMDSASLMSGARRALQVLKTSGSDAQDMQALATAIDQIAPLGQRQPVVEVSVAVDVTAAQDVDQIDTELLDIFLAEATEVFDTLQIHYPLVEADPTNSELLTIIRRGFHTLKGSGRMVGLDALGEAAWAIEESLNHWIAQTKPANPELMSLLRRASLELNDWIAEISQTRISHRSPDVFVAAAHILEQTGQFKWADGPFSSEPKIQVIADKKLQPHKEPTPSPLPEPKALSPDLLGSLSAAIDDALTYTSVASTSPIESLENYQLSPLEGEHLTTEEKRSEENTQLPQSEDVKRIGSLTISLPLYNIYVAEADENLRQLAQDLAEWQHEHGRPVSDQALRLAHTLAGSAATVGVASLHDLASALENVLLTCNREQRILDEHQSRALTDIVARLSQMHAAFASGEFPADEPECIAQLKLLDTVLNQVPVESSLLLPLSDGVKLQSAALLTPLDPAKEIIASVPADVSQKSGVDADNLHHFVPRIVPTESTTSFNTIEGSIDNGADHGVNPALEIKSLTFPSTEGETETILEKTLDEVDDRKSAANDRVESLASALEAAHNSDLSNTLIVSGTATIALEEGAQPTLKYAHLVPPDINTKDEFEPELFELFAQEAHEAFPAIGQILRGWQDNPLTSEPAQALLRILHTLKGSARMAGALRIGQNAHEMETRIEHTLNEQAITSSVLEEFHQRFDRMQLLFEVAQGLAPESALVQHPIEATEQLVPIVEPTAIAQTLTEVGASPSIDGNIIAFPTPTLAARKAWVTAESGSEAVTPQAETPQSGVVRVRSDILDRLVNQAGEVSISRSRVEAEVEGIKGALSELTENVVRLRSQLREIEIQAESQMASRLEMQRQMEVNFDPLEFDRFTRLQELTRLMAESVSDVATVQHNLNRSLMETERDLTAQARLTRELTQDLMRVRMIAFDSVSDRLYRVVRQAARETNKRVQLDIRGAAVEVDRSVLERMVGSFEHLLRNAIAHGLESASVRQQRGKNEMGQITVDVRQEGNEMRIIFSDDGNGLDFERIKFRAIERNLISADALPTNQDLTNLIFSPGFSTATELTELSGRGVGMDVVRTETALLGGRISVVSNEGTGTQITIFLPLTLAVTQVVLVRVGVHTIALPSALVAEVQHLKAPVLTQAYNEGHVQSRGNLVSLRYLGHLLELEDTTPMAQRYSPIVVMAQGEERTAIHIDEVIGNREVVVKNIGPQLARVLGISGATVLGSGEVVLIINPIPIAQRFGLSELGALPVAPKQESNLDKEMSGSVKTSISKAASLHTLPVVMVVDDSLTVRRISERLLTRAGYQVVLAKDGVDALRQLQEVAPDVMLVDIEMPRMDGFDLTRNVRSDPRYAKLPIIMITSRTADKHRNVAIQLGVNVFLGKPFQDEELLDHIKNFVSDKILVEG